MQLQARRADGVITIEGMGRTFWYELADDQRIRLACSADGALDLRAVIWPLAPASGPVVPIADAGPVMSAELGESFVLDGTRSRAFGGRRITKFVWTELS